MARINVRAKAQTVTTHEGGVAKSKMTPLQELRRTVVNCLLWENSFYEKGEDIAKRIGALVQKIEPGKVAELAVEARDKFFLRHTPLHVIRELARKGNGSEVAEALRQVVRRPDDITEFMAIYWKDGKQPISAGVRRGLADSFSKFNEYQLAKWNKDSAAIKLRDVLFLVHAKPGDVRGRGKVAPAVDRKNYKRGYALRHKNSLFTKLVDNTLETPDTWEVELSNGGNPKTVFTRLLTEKKLGGLATIRNLRKMTEAGVDRKLILDRLAAPLPGILPHQFVQAGRISPTYQDAIEKAMLRTINEMPELPGTTLMILDTSGSMDGNISAKSEVTRRQVAAGLALILREKCEDFLFGTFTTSFEPTPPRRGFALVDQIEKAPSGGTLLGRSLDEARKLYPNVDRIVVITDEQTADRVGKPWGKHNYMINVAPYKNGVSYNSNWVHIDGWSDRVYDFILASESLDND